MPVGGLKHFEPTTSNLGLERISHFNATRSWWIYAHDEKAIKPWAFAELDSHPDPEVG
jgi:hypothetical protein